MRKYACIKNIIGETAHLLTPPISYVSKTIIFKMPLVVK